MIISAIVARSTNNVIGTQNKMPWHLPKEFKYFKKITSGHHIVMGRKNYEAIGRPLPNRTNIIITRNTEYKAEGCEVVHNIKDALEIAMKAGENEVFIIGGGEIYKQCMMLFQKMYITEVHTEIEGDVFYPEFSLDEWKETSSIFVEKDEKNAFDFTCKVFEKKK